MRRLAILLAAVLLAAFGAASPVAAATSTAKVVIIVGATEGTTATYRSYADQAYAEAIKYTSRVTKIYSPNATWAKVKAATAGANIVLYYGHGNGWPSPYPYDPAYTTKDGFGLNDPTNLSDNVHKYYGEPYVADLGLAPNAIVLLGNLCYASGNSEPGGTPPTVSVAHQRIDNYAAGFLKGNAEAVIADGHGGLISYIRALFTTNQSIVNLWKSVPDFHNHVASFASTRSPGYTAYSDPDTTSGGYYRSLVTKPVLTSRAVISSTDTGTDPTSLVVPGRAEADTPATPLYASATGDVSAAASLELPAGTRLKTIAVGTPATINTPAMIQVQGLDDPSIAGYVAANLLTPKDSRPPVVVGVDTGIGRLSPTGDGVAETVPIAVLFSESVSWSLTIASDGGTVVKSASGTGPEADVTWDGTANGGLVADGTYTWTVRGTDAWQNGTATSTGRLILDTTPPTITAISPSSATSTVFAPNGDGIVDTVSTVVTMSEAGRIVGQAINGSGTVVRTWSTPAVAGTNTVVWDGKTNAGTYAPDGDYRLTFTPRDLAGNQGASTGRPVRLIGMLGFVAASAKVFYPQDGDTLASSTTLTFRLFRPATVTWTVRNAAGAIVATHLQAAAIGTGTTSWTFNGRRNDGTMLPVGGYLSYVTATDGTYTFSQSTRFEMNAFAITTSTSTARRGAPIVVTVRSAEPLSTSARVYVTQPGLATYYVTMTKTSTFGYKVTFTPRTAGAAGTMVLKVWARDTNGRSQATTRSLVLQ